MADATVVVVGHLVATSRESRDQLRNDLEALVEYSKINGPSTLKYAICMPDNDAEGTSIYVVEEYLDKDAYDTNMSSEPVRSLLTRLQSTEPPVMQSMNFKTVAWITSALLSRTDRLPTPNPANGTYDLRARVEHPYILLATITDPNKEHIKALEPYGAAIVKYATENEPDTIFYADALPVDLRPSDTSDDVEGGMICAVEVYASQEACGRHLQIESVKELTAKGNELGSKFEIVGMNMVAGWLTRD